MPRAKRVMVPGAVYHVSNRVARGEHLFRDEGEAGRLPARLVEAREILTILGVERHGFLVTSMAVAFNRYGETASRWISRGTRHRREDGEYRSRLENVDRAIASASAEVS